MPVKNYCTMINAAKNEYRTETSNWDNFDMALLLVGPLGLGKTSAARSYCEKYPAALYFSFRNIEARFAPTFFPARYPDIMTPCNDWDAFFSQVKAWAARKPCVLFFDDMDDRNDKEAFYTALQAFLKQNSHRRAFIVLILRKEAQNPIAHKTINIEPLALAAIYKQFPKLSREDALRLYAVTGGIPAVLSHFDSDLSYAENLHRFMQFDSPFCKYAEHVLSDCFRSPEAYNTLLYAMASGHNRITELAEYSGFPNNKCDKYLKALAGANLIDTTQKPDNAGRLRTNYDIRNSYLKLWFRYIYAFRSGVCPPGYEGPSALRCELDRTLVRETYRNACYRWLKHKTYYDTSYQIRFERLAQYNVVVDGYALDFVQRDNDRALIVKIWDDIDSRVDKAALDVFEAAAQKIRPFYDCTIILFAIHRFSDYCWECSGKYDNVKLVQIEGLLE